jgi:hypothetical protein
MNKSVKLDGVEILGLPIKRGEAEISTLGIADSGYSLRTEWIGQWVDPAGQSFGAAIGDGRLSLASDTFDALIVHGDDVGLLIRLVREARSMYLKTVLVAVQSRSGPTHRAALLYAGADAVWDVMQWPQEAAASLRSALNRQRMSDSSVRSISIAS